MLMLLTNLGFLLKKLNNFKFGQQLRTVKFVLVSHFCCRLSHQNRVFNILILEKFRFPPKNYNIDYR